MIAIAESPKLEAGEENSVEDQANEAPKDEEVGKLCQLHLCFEKGVILQEIMRTTIGYFIVNFINIHWAASDEGRPLYFSPNSPEHS